MLPSSHLAPINLRVASILGGGALCVDVDDSQIDEGCAGERDSEAQAEMRSRGAALLAGEFSEFILAASRLENSYRALQQEVSELGSELSERNAALNKSLAENERMRRALQQIVDSMPCGVLVLDRGGEISMINPESRRLLELDLGQFAEGSRATLRQISASSGINLEAFYESSSSSDSAQEFCALRSSGKHWIEVRNRRLFGQEGKESVSAQTIMILRDMTAQKRAEQEREVGRRAMALAEITTILAHEIRNPLASLELFAELIENDGDRRVEWISNLRAGIRSLSSTVNNVLSFHGSNSLALAPVVLSQLIGNSIQFVQPLADQSSVSLNWVPSDIGAMVMGNESALRQVVLNLISNAIRHTPAGGEVTVSLRSEKGDAANENLIENGEHIIAEFSDTGCGIRPDQISHVFEPGFSGSGYTSGLGLAVCERFMKQHGGCISASNRNPSGAQFTLSFPALQMEPASA
jgi:signal transduction histidine kinase